MINQDLLNQLEELTGGDKSILNEIFESFIADAKELKESIESSFKQNEFEKMQQATHALKGLSATVGANEIHQLARTIDFELKQSKSFQDKNTIENLSQTIDETIGHIESEIL